MSALISAIFYELLGNLDTYCISRNNTMFKQGDLLFNRFIELLSKSKVKVRSVSFYADKLFITTKYLSVICKQVCGKTAFDIINEFIIEDITELLKYSEKSIKEIANYLEFPNLSYFGKYVKAHTGMSPTQYRKHLINKL
jgi:AraC family transcriptional activator of pobA